MKKYLLAFTVTVSILFIIQPVFAAVIDFEDQYYPYPTGVFSWVDSSPQTITKTIDGVTVTFKGGVILYNTTSMLDNETKIYGTADPVTSGLNGSTPGLNALSNPIEIDFSSSVTNLNLEVLTGWNSLLGYTIWDKNGNTDTFNLTYHGDPSGSGHAYVGFANPGTTVYIGLNGVTGGPATDWDFFIDNVSFDVKTPSPVPVPATILLLGSGLLGLAGFRKKIK